MSYEVYHLAMRRQLAGQANKGKGRYLKLSTSEKRVYRIFIEKTIAVLKALIVFLELMRVLFP